MDNSVHLPTLLTTEFKKLYMVLACDRSALTREECEATWGFEKEEFFGVLRDYDGQKSDFKLWMITDEDGYGDPANFWCMTVVQGNDYIECHSVPEIITAYQEYRERL